MGHGQNPLERIIMHDFTLPANIKQIGSIGDGLRIYMEDYVCTFLHQYAAGGGYEERIAYLVGKHMLIDGQEYLFISGAIYGMHAEQMEGYTRFSQKSAEYAEAMLEEHFQGQEIVGWMQSQPSYGTYLNQFYGGYHLRQFNKPYQVLFVTDPLERTSAFYTANPNAITPAERITEVDGYFIYYEKNINMHEYMLTNKSIDYATPPPTFVKLEPVEAEHESDIPPFDPNNDYDMEDEEYDGAYERKYDEAHTSSPYSTHQTPKDIIRRHKATSTRRKNEVAVQKRAYSMLGTVCAVLFIVSFVMGVGLIRNQDRIDRLEAEIRQLVTAHRNLFAQVSNPELAHVFAETPQTQNTQPTQPTQAYVPTEPQTQVQTQAQTQVPTQTEPQVQAITEPPTTPPTTTPQTIAEITRPAPGSQSDTAGRVPVAYVIQPGDSLLAISLYFFGDANMVDEILALNNMEDPDLIVAGRLIYLPQR